MLRSGSAHGGCDTPMGDLALLGWKNRMTFFRLFSKRKPIKPRSFSVAVDGPAASGKGTVATEFDFAHLDSGSLYRKVAYLMIEEGSNPRNKRAAIRCAKRLSTIDVPDEKLRTSQVADVASLIAPIPKVRLAVLKYQRDFADHPPGNKSGAVIDGRDIGTVVLPQANVKLFVTASAEERARRRWKQLVASGEDVTFDHVLADINERDRRDQERHASPLIPAEDAQFIDSTDWEPDMTARYAIAIVRAALEAD